MRKITNAEERLAHRRLLRAFDRLDAAVFARTASSHSPLLDATLPALTRAADHCVLWIVVAGLLDGSGNRRAGRAARRGLSAVALTSLVANQVGKRLAARPRPSIALVPALRRAHRVPTSSSFPSGHAASAAAFATAVGLELPELAVPLGLLAGAVGYSRVFTGVHYPSDVIAGAALGGVVAVTLSRLAPSHTPAPVRAVGSRRVVAPVSTTGLGVVAVVNPRSGGGRGATMAAVIAAALPDATVVELEPGDDLVDVLTRAAAGATVLGIAGGDGTVSAAAGVAAAAGLPLLVLPGGTFNHFAADVGLRDASDAFAALRAGEAVDVDLATANDVIFLNTASLGAYPEFVAIRERYEARLGKPLAAVIGAVTVLRHAEPLAAVVDGQQRLLAMLFIGNGRYQPHGFAPGWRPRLDDGLLDVRFVEAGHRAMGTRLALALLSGGLGHSRIYHEDAFVDLTIEVPTGDTRLALDGEIGPGATQVRLRKRHRALVVYTPAPANRWWRHGRRRARSPRRPDDEDRRS